ncbi:nitrilase-related carbon-nitrogen hydrolase [Paenibacillus sp. Soil787]|uniref:nitrilase-related carbon-nitrogen hydrolase n=1 Tax=Paenibacillus sp. Soil787 TaxID=1736411 RepID=UPI0006FDBF45|nr:nitrilase-related carbon-nitrogen hydrolase [Paenibacillus sp. Soil787]KRF41918.1 nitrilase [Paenibacillus sp. Soil787]
MDRTESIFSSFKAAAVQFNPILGDVENNRHRMTDMLIEAAIQGAKLIVFPEMASSGYVWNDRKEISPYVETIPGPTTDTLFSITQKYQCYVAIGLPEVDPSTGAYYNSAVLIGPEGIVGSYRKTHLFAADPRWAREGNDGIPVFETEIGRIALLICMDAMYFEPSRIAALQGADIIAFPTNWVGASNNPPSKTWCLRAKENGLFWIASNRSDTERGAQFTGGSGIINPNGDVGHFLLDGEGIIYGEVNLDRQARQRLLENRRTYAYQELLLQPYLWNEGQTRSIIEPLPYEIVVCTMRQTQWKDSFFHELQSDLELATGQLSTKNRLFVLPELEVLCDSGSLEGMEAKVFIQLQQLSVMFDGYIVATLRNSLRTIAVLVGPEGTIGSYEQVHGYSADSKMSNYSEGFRTFELPFGRVGLLTEMDAELPESYRILAKQGADIIAISGTSEMSGNLWMKRIRAFENDAVLAYAKPFTPSVSLLFLHRQVNLETGQAAEWLIQRFEPEMTAAARRRDFMKRSKTHLYDLLI